MDYTIACFRLDLSSSALPRVDRDESGEKMTGGRPGRGEGLVACFQLIRGGALPYWAELLHRATAHVEGLSRVVGAWSQVEPAQRQIDLF